MPLMPSSRLSDDDLRVWRDLEKHDVAHGSTIGSKIARAMIDISSFLSRGPAYVSVSWGKDSVVVADLAMRSGISVPMICVVPEGIDQPENAAVRDAFLSMHPSADYREIFVPLRHDDDGYHATGSIEKGFSLAAMDLGTSRYLTGIRWRESGKRKRRHIYYGTTTPNTCAPISSWTGADVFGYLAIFDLPISPVYAMSMGGAIDRERLRTSWLTIHCGDEVGKAEWEARYFLEIVNTRGQPR